MWSNFRKTVWHSSQHLLYSLLCLTELSLLPLLLLVTFYSFFNGYHFPFPANTPTALSILFFSTSTRAFFLQITNISLLFSIALSAQISPSLYSHQCPSPFLEKQNKFYWRETDSYKHLTPELQSICKWNVWLSVETSAWNVSLHEAKGAALTRSAILSLKRWSQEN